MTVLIIFGIIALIWFLYNVSPMMLRYIMTYAISVSACVFYQPVVTTLQRILIQQGNFISQLPIPPLM